MERTELLQGSPEWHAHRNSYNNASEAPAMMGESPYQTRNEFIKARATGIVQEIDPATQRRFDDGHRFEALARPLAEDIIGEDLFPVTGTLGQMSASFDGLTMDDSINFEHKSLNDTIRACTSAADLPAYLRIQMDQQMLISGAKKTLFMASKWEKAPGDEAEAGAVYGCVADDFGNQVRYKLVEEKHFWYKPDLALQERIIAGWEQFNLDVANYQHVEVIPAAVAAPVKDFPVLFVQAKGEVTSTNMPEFKLAIASLFASLNPFPKTDQEFADSKELASKLREGAKAVKANKAAMLAQTATVGEVAAECDFIADQMNKHALTLEKAVEREEGNRKAALVLGGKEAFLEHITVLNKRLARVQMPTVAADFVLAIKGLRKVESMEDAIGSELARATADANRIAGLIETNLAIIDAHCEHAYLFNDLAGLCMKASDDLQAVITNRINAHKDAEAKKVEATKEREATQESNAKAELARQTEQKQKRYDDLKTIADKKPRVLEKLTRDRAEVLAWQAKVDDAKAKSSGAKSATLACPHCSGLLNMTHGVLVPHEEPAIKFDAEAAAALPEYEKALALFKASVSAGERDLRQTEDAALQMAAIFPADEERKAA